MNTVFWNNTATTEGAQVFNYGTATSTVRGCDVQGSGFSGASGNVDQDPLFVGTSAGALDLRLRSGSPCIDHGNNTDLPTDVLDVDKDGNTSEALPSDLAGAPRVQNGTVDIGAFEGSH